MFGFLGNLMKKAEQKYRVVNGGIKNLPQAVWMKRNAKTYAEEGYARNVIVFRCVEIIAKSVATIPLSLYRRDEKIEEHAVLDLLKSPNPTMTYEEMTEALVSFYYITGSTFLEALSLDGLNSGLIAAKGKEPRELWVWQPYNIRANVSRNSSIPISYIYEEGGNKRMWEVDFANGQSMLMHWKTFNPQDRIYGLSRVEPAADSADQHNEAGEWNKRLLQNAAVPPAGVSTEQELTDAQYKRLRKEIDENYSGALNAGKIMIMEGGIEFKLLGITPKDMDWLEGKRISAQEIAAAFGVPTQVIPVEGSQTFANYAEARLALWEDTVIPTAKAYSRQLAKFLFPKFGLDMREYSLQLDLDGIPALAQRRAELWNTANTSDFITVNEKRMLVGYDEIDAPEANEVLINAGKIPLTLGVEPEPDEENDPDMEEMDGTEDDNV